MAPALRYLEPSDMLALSTRWLGPDRAALAASPELAALLPRLTQAHEALAASTSAAPADPGQAQRLATEARGLDERHDHAVRALYYAVSAALSFRLASVDQDLDAVARLEALRDMILPEGLDTAQASYAEEAALAARSSAAVAAEPEAQALLREIRLLPRVSGLDALTLWSTLGQQLGALELQRGAASIGPAVRARNAWLGVAASLLSVAALLRDEESRRAVIDPLSAACDQAARRRASRR
ncbi:MAG: hypothetical protein EOO75_01475 [Myxococcales bacterium]|nr:MAG: hypothetical protein EOO75_01475 [Myxococcales bacterium]